MSRDIRSFFQTKKPLKPKIEEDDDVIPESPDVQIKIKKKESRKKRVIQDDSDEEIFTTKKKKSDESSKTSKSKNVKSPQKPALKEVKVSDLFGSAPIKRTEPLVKKEKKTTEVGIHSDDDFDKSLLELDIIDEASPTKSPIPNNKIKENDKNELKAPKELSKKMINKKSPVKKEINDKTKSNHTSEIKTQAESNSRSVVNEMKNEKKRKFAEFIESDNKQDKDNDDKNKKKKLNDSVTKPKTSNKTIVSDKTMDDSHSNDSDTTIIMDEEKHNKTKKKKLDKTLNDSVLTDEERHEKRRLSAALYQNYLHRAPPKHLGAKEIPEGSSDCLKDCAFLLTGVLESFEREDIVAAITKYGGCIKSGISKKVTHVLAGEDAGPAKMAKAEDLGIKIINEDQFLQLIANSRSDKAKAKESEKSKKEVKKEKSPNRKDKTPQKKLNGVRKDVDLQIEEKVRKRESEIKISDKVSNSDRKETKNYKEIKRDIKSENVDVEEKKVVKLHENVSVSANLSSSLMWVDKYKPQNVKQIIGQHGDASNVKKLTNWLTKWYVNRKAKLPKPNPWAKNDDGGYYKAALLSGPPGVGKTTTVALVCKELGFDMVEFNASDTRNKTLIKAQIGEMLNTTSLSAYSKGDTGKQAVTKKHVLVMDEVDGMAGNEDRGGLQELISLIKITSVPIICMCNDRNSQKMRSFVNYCYDLRFSRPRVDQIKSAMMSICFKEGIKIPPDVLTQLIVAASQDVRQTLNLLSMWAVDSARLDADKLRKDAQNIRKDIKLGPWEAIRKVFSAEEHKSMSIHDRSDLFFYDYSLAPLFVQENYLQVAPHCPKNQVLDRISKTADSISIGDMVDKRIRSAQAWSLLPLQAMYSSVIPGYEMSGHMTGQINFPGWLGKNSRATKMHRLCQEIHAHTRLSTSGSKSSIFLDYCTHLRDAVVTPLINDKSEGIDRALEVLESYHLLRDDLDSLTEMSLWPGQRNPMILIDSKVKAAMTRTYNKKATALPYAPGSIKRGKAKEDDEFEDETQIDDEEEDSDPENDALIKKKKVEKASTSKEKSGSSKEKASSSKEKASSSKDKPSSSKKKK